MSHITDLTFAVGLIVERLRSELPEGVQVERMTDFSALDFAMWPAPAVYVILGSISPQPGAGAYVPMEQVFHVVPVVNNASAIQGGGGPDEEGGTLAVQCINALQNWTPDDRYDPMTLQPGNPIDFAPGRAMYPLAFRTETSLMGHVDLDT